MSRRRRERKKIVILDPKFGEQVVAKFINSMMWSGKRSTSEGAFYGALDLISEKQQDRPGIEVFHAAMDNVRPVVEVRSRRVGGATYQVPTEVRPERRDALAIRWLVANARERGEKSIRERLAAELLDAANNRGNAVKKKEDTHRMAEANRAFAHYRW
jgi:small subunit ribosomal protein S7